MYSKQSRFQVKSVHIENIFKVKGLDYILGASTTCILIEILIQLLLKPSKFLYLTFTFLAVSTRLLNENNTLQNLFVIDTNNGTLVNCVNLTVHVCNIYVPKI